MFMFMIVSLVGRMGKQFVCCVILKVKVFNFVVISMILISMILVGFCWFIIVLVIGIVSMVLRFCGMICIFDCIGDWCNICWRQFGSSKKELNSLRESIVIVMLVCVIVWFWNKCMFMSGCFVWYYECVMNVVINVRLVIVGINMC